MSDFAAKAQTLEMLGTGLGYPYQRRVVDDCTALFAEHPYLKPTQEPPPQIMAGHGPQLIKLYGTVEVPIGGKPYYIPLEAWIPKRYPEVPPVVKVVPSQGMVLTQGHPRVEMSGVCRLRSNWMRAYTVGQVVSDLRAAFAQQSPVHAVPTQQPPQTGGGYSHYTHNQPTTHAPNHMGHSAHRPPSYNPSFNSGYVPPPSANPYAASTAAPVKPSPALPPGGEDTVAMQQLASYLKSDITGKLTTMCRELRDQTEVTVKGEVERQGKQNVELEEVQKTFNEASLREAALVAEVAELEKELGETREWIEKNEGKVVTVDDVRPKDELSLQILELSAEVNVYDDMLRLADHSAKCNPDKYVANVMTLARKKFLTITHLNKATAAAKAS